MSKPILYYVYDPMCSWCWGYRDSWLKLSAKLAKLSSELSPEHSLEIRYQLGGLAPDSDVVMPMDMQQTLQNIWRNIHAQLGTQFNFDFWTECKPQRSTYPACRACLIARNEGKEKEMLFAIQQGYYLQAKNPSLTDVLAELAEGIGFDKAWFKQQLHDDAVNKQLFEEINTSRQLPIQGFPSLVLSIDGKNTPLALEYLDWQKTYSKITEILQFASK